MKAKVTRTENLLQPVKYYEFEILNFLRENAYNKKYRERVMKDGFLTTRVIAEELYPYLIKEGRGSHMIRADSRLKILKEKGYVRILQDGCKYYQLTPLGEEIIDFIEYIKLNFDEKGETKNEKE